MKSFKAIALATLAGTCAPAIAQDSVSNITGFPGDALDPTAVGDQCREYVVDLTRLQTSKGTVFGIAPILKSTRVNSGFFNNLITAQSISPDMLTGVGAPSSSYALWTGAPGFGVNNSFNDAPGSIAGPASSTQFAATFAEFGTTDGGGSYNGVVSGVVNYDPADPNRLYVTRRHSATNLDTTTGTYNLAQFGIGSIDADGNVYFRADDFGVAAGGGFVPIAGNNLFRTDNLARNCNSLNLISGSGTTDATAALLTGSATAHVTPNMIPESVFGAPGSVATSNFSTLYVYGAGPTLSSGAHIPAGFGSDTRGSLGYSSFDALGGGGIASFAQLGHDAAGDARVLYVWEVGPTGAPTGNFGADSTAVATFTDPTTGFVLDPAAIGVVPEFDHKGSQTAFRGGTGQVALGRDQAGRTIVAATHEDDSTAANDYFSNSILAARWVPGSQANPLEWTVVAYLDQLSGSSSSIAGKPICDGNGDAIGRLVPLFDVTGGTPLGPSMSSPSIDSVGNVWFIGAVGLFKNADGTPRPVPFASAQAELVDDFDSALIRAVYNPATFGYELELVVELGDTFVGANSDRAWSISFMGIADSNSVSSGGFFSSNVSEKAWNDMSTSGLSTSDARTNGGVVVNAEIQYNVDNADSDLDGNPFNDQADEEYNALLYIGYYNDAPSCPCDLNGDGLLTPDDIAIFVTNFTDGTVGNADIDGDGDEDPDDIAAFVDCFTATPPLPGC